MINTSSAQPRDESGRLTRDRSPSIAAQRPVVQRGHGGCAQRRLDPTEPNFAVQIVPGLSPCPRSDRRRAGPGADAAPGAVEEPDLGHGPVDARANRRPRGRCVGTAPGRGRLPSDPIVPNDVYTGARSGSVRRPAGAGVLCLDPVRGCATAVRMGRAGRHRGRSTVPAAHRRVPADRRRVGCGQGRGDAQDWFALGPAEVEGQGRGRLPECGWMPVAAVTPS